MSLPSPGMSFSPFAILTAEEMNDLVENIEALAAGTGLNTGAVSTTKIADTAVTSNKVDYMTVPIGYGLVVKASNQTSSGAGGFIDEVITFPSTFTSSSSNYISWFTMTSSNQINIVQSGKYKITINYVSSADGAPKIYKNGSILKTFGYMRAFDNTSFTLIYLGSFVANDKVTLVSDQTTASKIYYGGTGTGNYISMLIEPALT